MKRPYDPRHHAMATIGVLGLASVAGYVFLAFALGIPFAIPVGIVGAGAAAVALRGPVGQAIARRLDGSEPQADEATGQLLGEMDELRGRLQEAEERLDFAERMLARGAEEHRPIGPAEDR